MNTDRAADLAATTETETSMGKMKDLHAVRYEHTHYSRRDGSPAMHEDGDVWVSAPDAWATYDEIDWESINEAMA